MKSMKGKIGGCLRNKKKKTKTKACGLSSLPDEIVSNCLVHVSRLDLAALAMTSKAHRSLATSPYLWDLRWRMKCIDPSYYVCLHIFPEPVPRWFILHPVKRQLKPVPSLWFTESGSSFVVVDWCIYIIGGLVNGKPTSTVARFDCFEHTWYESPPMKMPRAFASVSMIDKKLYVFGGCGDDVDSSNSNWAEVYDLHTFTWDFLCVPSTTRLKSIKQSVVIGKKEVYAVDEDGQSFSFSPLKLPPHMFVSCGKTDGDRDDWCLIGEFLFSRGAGGTILWCLPHELDWKEVKGLEALQLQDISKLSRNYACNIVIYWNAQPQGAESLELWSAEISLKKTQTSQGLEIRGKIEWSGSVYHLTDSNKVKDAVDTWLDDPSTSKLKPLLAPYENSDLVWYPVTCAIGKPTFGGPECIQEIPLKASQNSLISKFFSAKQPKTEEVDRKTKSAEANIPVHLKEEPTFEGPDFSDSSKKIEEAGEENDITNEANHMGFQKIVKAESYIEDNSAVASHFKSVKNEVEEDTNGEGKSITTGLTKENR